MKITLKPSQRLWVTSDIHYSHKNICEGTSTWDKGSGQRPFQTVEEMNSVLVSNINSCVGANDILYILGDVAFGNSANLRAFREQLNCKDIHVILGNHDNNLRKNKDETHNLFTRVRSYDVLHLGEHELVLFHFPLATWDCIGRGTMHIHGHCHRKPDKRFDPGKSMDIGVDGHELMPYTIDDILGLMKDRPLGNYLGEDYHLRETR